MTNRIKLAFLTTTILAAGALGVAADTTTVAPAASTVVGTTAEGDLVVATTTYTIVAAPMTEAEIAAVNSELSDSDGQAPGPYLGWEVTSSDMMPLGKISYSVQDEEGKIATFNMRLADGRGVSIANGVAKMGDGTIQLRITLAELMANTGKGFTAITVQ